MMHADSAASFMATSPVPGTEPAEATNSAKPQRKVRALLNEQCKYLLFGPAFFTMPRDIHASRYNLAWGREGFSLDPIKALCLSLGFGLLPTGRIIVNEIVQFPEDLVGNRFGVHILGNLNPNIGRRIAVLPLL